MQDDRHSLREIFNIINISKNTLEDLEKCGIFLNKMRLKYLHKLSERDKRRIELLIERNHTIHHLFIKTIIEILRLNVSITTLKLTLKDLGY